MSYNRTELREKSKKHDISPLTLYSTVYMICLAIKLLFVVFEVPVAVCLAEARPGRVGQCRRGTRLLPAAGEERQPIPARRS